MPDDSSPTSHVPPATPPPLHPGKPTVVVPRRTSIDAAPHPGDTIGHYKLLELLGEGGFGVVWLVEQTEPVRRRVALKVIKPGMDSKAVLARFEAERQALAMMNHPNIAKVFDAGATPADAPGGIGPGRPYFVMEHVKGSPITDYCDKHRLTIEQRLRLFITVCDAVQHAHMKGIIHRDLKPANILVSVADTGSSPDISGGTGGARPVIIDFGVAKALSGRLSEQTIYTERGMLIGTPEYMSPEQAEMAETDIDTRSDVYALGAILYELLTGSVPFDAGAFRAGGVASIQKMIREVDPPRPSTRFTTMVDAGKTAAARHTGIDDLATKLRRELEWIPLKAMRKDRTERYRSAAELADDVGNYLAHRPLIAGPESTAYKVRKFVRRNKGAAVAGAVIGACLVLATGVSLWFGLRESAARQRESVQRAEAVRLQTIAEASAAAETKARTRAEAINAFVAKTLRSSDPSAGGKQDTTIADAMKNAIKEIDSGTFKNDPETEAGLKDTIATILLNNGKREEAEPLFVQALETRKSFYKGDNAEVASSLGNLATLRQFLGRPAEAEPLYVQSLEMYQRLYPGDHPDVVTSLGNLATVRQALGRHAEAEPLYLKSLEMSRRLEKGDSVAIALCLNNLALVRDLQGHTAEAEPVYLEALEMRRRIYKGDHPSVANTLNNLAAARITLGRPAEAEPLLVEALEMRQRLFKGDHPDIAASLTTLARTRMALGKTAEAQQEFDDAIAMLRRLSPNGSPLLARVLWRSGSARLEAKDAASALPQLEEALTMAEKFLPPEHPHIKEYRESVAKCKAALDK